MPKRKKIIFVCIGNSCRSQMAEGFLRHWGGDKFEAFSAGSHPAGFVHPKTIEVMREKGIDISTQHSKGLEDVPLEEADVVITMGCCSIEEVCPVTYAGDERDWDIADPIGQPIEVFREVRDDIERRVRELVGELSKEKG
jgi:arsenate reductase